MLRVSAVIKKPAEQIRGGVDMPRTSLSRQAYKDREIEARIDYLRKFKGLTPEDLWEALGIDRSTWYKRMRDPDSFRLLELRKLAKRLNTTIMVILEGPIT